jgi:hypothetical protein
MGETIARVAAPLLEELEVVRVRRLEDLGDIGRFPRLRRLSVEDQIVYLTQLDIDALLAAGMPASLKQLSFSTGKKKRDDAIRSQLTAPGYEKARFY